MKKDIILFVVLLAGIRLYAYQKLCNQFKIQDVQYSELNACNSGWIELNQKEQKDYTDGFAWDFSCDDSMIQIKIFPSSCYCGSGKKQGMIQFNEHSFSLSSSDEIYLDTVHVYSMTYKQNKYLFLTAELISEKFLKCFVFNITDSADVKFILTDDKYIDVNFGRFFCGNFRDELCLFLSENSGVNTNEYLLRPYVLESEKIIPFIESGKEPYVDYMYVSKKYGEYRILNKSL